MAELKLGCGDIALVDDEDIERLGRSGWYGHHNPSGGVYVHRTVRVGDRKRNQALHRMILGAERGQVVDHINGNPLDNRRSNLRFATPSENRQNTHHPVTKKRGMFKGVHRHGHKYVATIHAGPPDKDGEMGRLYLGLFATPEEAARAYDSAALHYFGEFAAPNFPDAKACAPQTAEAELFEAAFLEGYQAAQADAARRARRMYLFEMKARLVDPEPAAPAPSLKGMPVTIDDSDPPAAPAPGFTPEQQKRLELCEHDTLRARCGVCSAAPAPKLPRKVEGR